MTTGRINQVAILLRNAGRSRVSLHNMARPSRGTAPRASAPPPAAIAAGRRHTRRRDETPPRRVADRPQPTAAEGATPAQGASRASAAPHGKGPERSRAQEPAHAAAPRARKRIHAVQSNAPTHLAGREHRTPTQQGAGDGSRPPGTIVGDNDDRGDRAPPDAPGGTGGGTRRATAASPAARSTDQCSKTVRIHTSHTVNVRKPKGSLFLDARRPGAHTTTHAPGPPQTVPHRILGTRSTPAPAPAGTKRKQGDPTPFNGCAARAKPNTHRAHAHPARRGTNRGAPDGARPMLVPSSPYAT